MAATDFSDESIKALRKAEELTLSMGGEMYAAHIIEDSLFGASKDTSSICKHSFLVIKSALPSIEMERFYCKRGDVKEELSKLAKELDASFCDESGITVKKAGAMFQK